MPKFALVAAAAPCPALPAFANATSLEFRAEPRFWAPRPEVFTGRQSVRTPVTPLLRRGESGSAGGHRTLPAQDDLRACRRRARATIELQLREPAPRAGEATERELLRRYIDVRDRDDADFLSVIHRLVEPTPGSLARWSKAQPTYSR